MNSEINLINCIITKNDIITPIKRIKSDCFLNPVSKEVYEFLMSYFKSYKNLPSISVINEKFPDFELQIETTDINYLIDKVLEKKCETDVTDLIIQSTNSLKEKGSFNALELIKQRVLEINSTVKPNDDIDITQNTDARFDRYVERAAISGLIGIPSGFPTMDSITSGFQKGQLILVVGLTGIGKSFLSVFLAAQAWKEGYKVLFVSLEMGEYDISNRFDCLVAKLGHNDIRRGKLNQEELIKYKEYLKKLKDNSKTSFIVSSPIGCTQSDILALIQEHKPDICYVDYSRLVIDDRGQTDYKGVSNVVLDLRNFAKDIGLPIVVLNQINRGFDKTLSELPSLQDIAHSFAAAQDSDLVIACHATDAMQEDKEMLMGIIKHRNGPNLKLWLKWDLDSGNIQEKHSA